MKFLIHSVLLVTVACQSATAWQDGGHAARASAGGVAGQSKTRGSSEAKIMVDDFHGKLVLTLQPDGSVEATLDGMPVPPEHLQREGDRLRVLDADGDKAYDLTVMGDPVLLGYPYKSSGRSGGGVSAWKEMFGVGSSKRHVIGVVTTPVDAGLAAQLGLEPDSAVIVNEVSSGLPAEKAGVKPFDVITKIDGAGPVTRETLRERVTAADVGKTLKLTLVRRGQPQDLDVPVGETSDDDASLSRVLLRDPANGDSGVWNFTTAYGDAVHDEAAMEKAHAELQRAHEKLQARIEELQAEAGKGGATGEAAAKAADELRAAVQSMEDAQASMKERADGASPEVRFFNVGPDGNKGLLVRRSGNGQSYVVREDADNAAEGMGGGGAGAASDKRIAELEARIEQLDARVAELVKALESSGKKQQP